MRYLILADEEVVNEFCTLATLTNFQQYKALRLFAEERCIGISGMKVIPKDVKANYHDNMVDCI